MSFAEDGYKLEVFRYPEGHRRAGWWSFTINGQESHYRSSQAAGLERTMRTLLFGPEPGRVRLRAVRGGATPMGSEATLEVAPPESWTTLPTSAERIAAFMTRGKLANPPAAPPPPPVEQKA